MSLLPALITSKAVGNVTALNNWDDNVQVGLWPARENIQQILSVTLWVGANQINGIQTRYMMTNNSPQDSPVRGQQNGTQHVITAGANQFFVGIYGSRDNDPDTPTLRRLGFLLYDQNKGDVTPSGTFPPGPGTNTVGFTSLGLIVAFSGTTSATNNLDTLSVYKFQAGQEAVGVFNN
ncbi:hypothetical protein BDZ94DRAFT_1247810 [Collybia nuda]|uniref:Jacalin-type lectin domain-containing protein n=1 Tax=Collybia nuda TaxID=64659 RepID=A0A9P5YF95_9AGAR|nr:hypothetical protein BDZ94DRAFT_1247810 [Collybia nuda]